MRKNLITISHLLVTFVHLAFFHCLHQTNQLTRGGFPMKKESIVNIRYVKTLSFLEIEEWKLTSKGIRLFWITLKNLDYFEKPLEAHLLFCRGNLCPSDIIFLPN